MTREEKIREARLMRAALMSSTDIGRLLNVPPSTVRNWCLGDDCIDCGAPSDGCNGVKAARCSPCNHAWRHATRTWTADAVVDAIRRWAAANGRAPLANDWLHADLENGYPNRGSVYRSIGNEGAPFAKWADAIEAAGFSRPLVGMYERTPEIKARMSAGQRRRYEAQRQAAA